MSDDKDEKELRVILKREYHDKLDEISEYHGIENKTYYFYSY